MSNETEPFVIPHDQRGHVDALERNHTVLRIQHECAISRYKNAVAAGDADEAIQELDTGFMLERERNAAVEAFWGFIRELFPEVTTPEEWTFNCLEYTIRPRGADDSLLGRMLQAAMK
jgi:hypothetical protein